MNEKDEDLVIPIVREEVHAEAVPVATGGVRVTKRVESHDEIVEQELRKSHVEVKRVKTDRVVDGPQPVQRVGNTLIVPVVSEVLRIEKQWVLTEEIHITEVEERETVRSNVTLNSEQAQIERLDSENNVIAPVVDAPERSGERRILQNTVTPDPAPKKRTLGQPRSILKNRRGGSD